MRLLRVSGPSDLLFPLLCSTLSITNSPPGCLVHFNPRKLSLIHSFSRSPLLTCGPRLAFAVHYRLFRSSLLCPLTTKFQHHVITKMSLDITIYHLETKLPPVENQCPNPTLTLITKSKWNAFSPPGPNSTQAIITLYGKCLLPVCLFQ